MKIKNLLICLFLVSGLNAFPKDPVIPASEAKLKEEINEIIREMKNEAGKKVDQREKWDIYIRKIRKDANLRSSAVEKFNKQAGFFITLKRTTFIKSVGGFEHTPMCIVLPVQKNKILVGSQLCTTPSMKRLYPLKDFMIDLHKEIADVKTNVAEMDEELEKLKKDHKALVESLAKVMEALPEYENNEAKIDEYRRLTGLIDLYKKQIRDITSKIKRQEAGLKIVKDREKHLLIANDFINSQMTFYGLIEDPDAENAQQTPLAAKLKELDNLLKQGLITQEDFDKAKAKLLSEIK